jgi:hypothetical protein
MFVSRCKLVVLPSLLTISLTVHGGWHSSIFQGRYMLPTTLPVQIWRYIDRFILRFPVTLRTVPGICNLAFSSLSVIDDGSGRSDHCSYFLTRWQMHPGWRQSNLKLSAMKHPEKILYRSMFTWSMLRPRVHRLATSVSDRDIVRSRSFSPL